MYYYMPTEIFFEEHCIEKNKEYFIQYGSKALIVTGKHSSKKNGSLKDVIDVLEQVGMTYSIFDQVEENPSLETVRKGANLGTNEQVDFIIGIGGGSPLDAAKAIGVLINNQALDVKDLYVVTNAESIPILLVPTTAGTGSEVTPYAILTDHSVETKRNISIKIYPKAAFLDPRYFENMPYDLTVLTAVDTLSHLIESYLTKKANMLNEYITEKGLTLWGECIEDLRSKEITCETREKLLMASTLGGMVITQTGTLLPHAMSYPLTYYHQVPHGRAVAIFLPAFLKHTPLNDKVRKILDCLGLDDLVVFENLIKSLLGEVELQKALLDVYSNKISAQTRKLQNHPYEISVCDIRGIYEASLKLT